MNMGHQYVDIPPDLMGKADPDQQWIERELDRIAPSRHEQGHEGAETSALRQLVLEQRTARIAAQTENEALKAERARSGVEQRRAVREAVLAEREACAALVQEWNTAMTDKLAAAIRARGAA